MTAKGSYISKVAGVEYDSPSERDSSEVGRPWITTLATPGYQPEQAGFPSRDTISPWVTPARRRLATREFLESYNRARLSVAISNGWWIGSARMMETPMRCRMPKIRAPWRRYFPGNGDQHQEPVVEELRTPLAQPNLDGTIRVRIEFLAHEEKNGCHEQVKVCDAPRVGLQGP